MSYQLALAVIDLFEMLIAFMFFSKFAEKRAAVSVCLLIGALLFESQLLVNQLFQNSLWINVGWSVVIHFTFAALAFRIKPRHAVFFAVLLTIFITALEFSVIFVISFVADAQINAYRDDLTLLIIEGSICKILYFIAVLILMRFIRGEEKRYKLPLSFFMYPVSTTLVLLTLWYICLTEPIAPEKRITIAILCLLLYGVSVVFYFTYQKHVQNESDRLLLENELKKLQTEASYYEILKRQNEQLARYAHDTKNHLEAIRMLNTDPRAEKYADMILKDLTSYTTFGQTGNKALDVILYKYRSECELSGVELREDLNMSNLGFLEDLDLVTVLGNLLDNAVEAAKQSDGKRILIETDRRNKYIVLHITNSCAQPPHQERSRLKTIKTDGTAHGIGLKNVERTAEKYGGGFFWEYDAENNRFIATVSFLPER